MSPYLIISRANQIMRQINKQHHLIHAHLPQRTRSNFGVEKIRFRFAFPAKQNGDYTAMLHFLVVSMLVG